MGTYILLPISLSPPLGMFAHICTFAYFRLPAVKIVEHPTPPDNGYSRNYPLKTIKQVLFYVNRQLNNA